MTGGPSMSLFEVDEAARAVKEAAHPDANIIFGAMVDDKLDDEIWITVVATRFDGTRGPRPRHAEPTAAPGPERDQSRRGRRTGFSDLEVPEFIPGS